MGWVHYGQVGAFAVVVALVSTATTAASAQDETEAPDTAWRPQQADQSAGSTDRLRLYVDRHLELRLPDSFFGGGSFKVYRGGEVLDDWEETAEVANPNVRHHVDSYQTLNTVGTITALVSLAANVVAIVVLVDTQKFSAVFWSFLLGGLGSGIASSILLVNSRSHLNSAIDGFNGDLRRRIENGQPLSDAR